MTFAEARSHHLKALEAELVRIRELVADPEFLNTMWGDLQNAKVAIGDRIEILARLNQAEREAQDTSCLMLRASPR